MNPKLGIWRFDRVGSLDPNPTTISLRAQSWSQHVQSGTVLLVTKVNGVVRDYMIAPESHTISNKMEEKLAQTVASRAVKMDDSVDIAHILDTPSVSYATFTKDSRLSRDPIVGTDVAEISRLIAQSIYDDEWVAISLRQPSSAENKRFRPWLNAQLGTSNPSHPSLNAGAIIATLWAGAQTSNESRDRVLSLAGALRGFDYPITPKTSSVRSAMWKWGALVGLGALVATLGIVSADLPEQFQQLRTPVTLGGFGTAVLGILGMLGIYFGLLPSEDRSIRRMIQSGTLPAPPARRFRPRKPVKEHLDRKSGKLIEETFGDYPMEERSFRHAAEVFVGMIAPHSGAQSGSSGVSERRAIAELRRMDAGFKLGMNSGERVCLSALDMRQSVCAFGRRGSGKSFFVHGIYSWMSLDKLYPTNNVGYPGKQNTMIAFETKSWSGAGEYTDRTKFVGVPNNMAPLRLDLADPEGYAIDVFSLPGMSARERAVFLTSAMIYVFGEVSIGHRSKETLEDLFLASLMMTPAIASQVSGIETDCSPFYYTSILLGSRGDALAIELATAIRSEAARSDADPELVRASEGLDKYFVGVTPANRAARMDAPRSKLPTLLDMEQFWSRPKKFTWEKLFTVNASVVINTANAPADLGMRYISEEASSVVAQFLLFSLKQSIERNCDGNEKRGKWVSIFADELAMLASSSGEIIQWLQDKGRSYGVICVFATQRIEQLDPKVRDAVIGFGSIVVMNQLDVEIAESITRILSVGGTEWEASDIVNLEEHVAIVRTLYQNRSVPPFTVRVDNYFDPSYNFADENGFTLAA